MNTHAVRANRCKLLILASLVLLCAAGYMLIEVNFSNPKLFAYAMKIRTPKLIVMLITAFSIGGASLVFQSIINNTIVTPCLLGMNSLYTLIHTAVVFFLGSASVIASNANLSFAMDVVLIRGRQTREIVESTIRKLDAIPEPECRRFIADTKQRFIQKRDNSIRRRLAEAKAQARTEKPHPKRKEPDQERS